MKAGLLRHQVILQSPAGARDAVGERITTWTDVATVWARIEPLNARELFAAAQAQAATTHRVTIRYSADYAASDAAWRVQFGSRVFVVDGVRNPDERNVMLDLLCTEGLKSE